MNHIAIDAGSLDEALAFYGRLFELELRGGIPGMAFIDMATSSSPSPSAPGASRTRSATSR